MSSKVQIAPLLQTHLAELVNGAPPRHKDRFIVLGAESKQVRLAELAARFTHFLMGFGPIY